MKWFKIGCITLSSIVAFFTLSWIGAYAYYNINKAKIQLDDEDIMALQKCSDQVSLHWYDIVRMKHDKFNNKPYLSKSEFLSVLGGLEMPHEEFGFFKDNIPDTGSVSFCGDEGFSYELYSICEVHPFFPDCYIHYVSMGKKEMCPWLISYENEIVLKENITGEVYYTISRNYWD